MIYLDGSRFFFDIEGCFSNLVNSAREHNKNLPGDKSANELCTAIAKHFSVKKDHVKAALGYDEALHSILKNDAKVVVPELDGAADILKSALSDSKVISVGKTSDLKVRIADIIGEIENSNADAVFFSNPCFPTTLLFFEEDIVSLAKTVKCKVIVDESHIIDNSVSLIKYVNEIQDLVVLKKMRFGGDFVAVFGNVLPDFDCKMAAEDQAAAKIIFEHDSAIKTAERKLTDSIDSLYIRIKKLAIKYDSVERLFRSKSDSVFMKVKDAERRGKELFENGISIYYDENYFCVFAGDKDENEALLSALEKVLQ